jgi:preprotein translocase subunit SecE
MKLTRRGELVIYPLLVLAIVALMGIAGWIEGGM